MADPLKRPGATTILGGAPGAHQSPRAHKPEGRASRALNQRFVQRLIERLGAGSGHEQTFGIGQLLLRSGERPQRLPLVISGRLDAVLALDDAGAQVIPISFGSGELAMLSALFADEPTQADLVAGTAAQVRWLPVRAIEAELQRDAELPLLLVRFLTQRLRELQARERAWLGRGVHERVCATLLRLAREAEVPQPGRWRIAATHEELAMRCGVSRPKLSHELKRLERAGHLRLQRAAIEVLDLPALAAALR